METGAQAYHVSSKTIRVPYMGQIGSLGNL